MTKEESLAAGRRICFADEAGQSRGGRGHHFYVRGQTVLHFFALALCQQPTPLSLSPLWELLPPSRSDRERLETKEEKYRRPLGLLSLLKQDILWREEEEEEK